MQVWFSFSSFLTLYTRQTAFRLATKCFFSQLAERFPLKMDMYQTKKIQTRGKNTT